MKTPAYDRMGLNYKEVRRADPRIEAAIQKALGDAKSVLNVGAGTGSYEPADRDVIAVEPSAAMIAQRSASAAPIVQANAEDLPFDDDSFDAAMAVLTIHHWADLTCGLAELQRVAKRRIVLLTVDSRILRSLWLTSDYFPAILEIDAGRMPSIELLERILPGSHAAVVPVPRDCRDGFGLALWGQPEAVLDPEVRRGSSAWHEISPADMKAGVERLREDLENGAWDHRYGHLRKESQLDVGLRLVVAQLG